MGGLKPKKCVERPPIAFVRPSRILSAVSTTSRYAYLNSCDRDRDWVRMKYIIFNWMDGDNVLTSQARI